MSKSPGDRPDGALYLKPLAKPKRTKYLLGIIHYSKMFADCVWQQE